MENLKRKVLTDLEQTAAVEDPRKQYPLLLQSMLLRFAKWLEVAEVSVQDRLFTAQKKPVRKVSGKEMGR